MDGRHSLGSDPRPALLAASHTPGAARVDGLADAALRASLGTLVATVWASTTLFGLYILAFYAAALARGDMARWNEVLPRLHEPATPLATAGIGLHFAAGGIVLVMGAIQLLAPLRERLPALHRALGRIYVLATLGTGLGGLAFIAAKGTIGGTVMDVGFGLYGLLTVIAAVQAFRHARARRLELHRAWAIRLFALAIGSWLYRIDYGFWIGLAGGVGHTDDFTGPFDRLMAFFFYLPNLAVAEVIIRARPRQRTPATRLAASGVLAVAAGFLLVGTYFFTRRFWGPAILEAIAGRG
ncbi:MAG: DUF2306 domain-containing protein [Steroidobacteraceae bacterium]|jgi:uncharacterized membrane protein|nr:DUF2306 domain-containing protein [Steroidobacteraceae bacterium]